MWKFLGLLVLVLMLCMPSIAKAEMVAVDITTTQWLWTYSGDVTQVDYWEAGCGNTSLDYSAKITRFNDTSIMGTMLANIVTGPGTYFCAMRAGNLFGMTRWSTEIAFLTGSPPEGDVTPHIEISAMEVVP